jgi:hypothetical protein
MDVSSLTYLPTIPNRPNSPNGAVAPSSNTANATPNSDNRVGAVEYIAKTDPEQPPPQRQRGRNAVEDTFLQVEQGDSAPRPGQLLNIQA